MTPLWKQAPTAPWWRLLWAWLKYHVNGTTPSVFEPPYERRGRRALFALRKEVDIWLASLSEDDQRRLNELETSEERQRFIAFKKRGFEGTKSKRG